MKLEDFLDTYGHDPNPQAADDFAKVDVGKVRRSRDGSRDKKSAGLFGGTAQFKLLMGDDAELRFGKYTGRRVSELVNDAEGRRYLREFVLPGEFPVALKRLIRGKLA